jgi:hypothetical protein
VVGGFAHNWWREIEHDGARRKFRFDAGVHDISGTCAGRPPDRAFAEMDALLGAPPATKLALRAKDIRGDRLAAALRPFVAQLAERKAAA